VRSVADACLMGKLLLSLVALLSMSFGPAPTPAHEGSDRMPKPLTISPNPPTQGQSATIKGNPGDVIDLDWDPLAEPGTVTLGSDGKAVVTVPRSAMSLIMTDPDGNSVSTSIQPK
jgi:hypothetical protein